MRHAHFVPLALSTFATLSACSTSTPAPGPFDTGLDPARTATSLTVDEATSVCEQFADATQADFDRLRPIACLSVAAYADTEASCLSAYDQCMTRLEGAVTFPCDPAGRVSPAENPSVCAGVTVAQLEGGVTAWLHATTSTTAASLCAMPLAERMSFGDLSHFGASESDIAGYNCAVNTTLHPRLLCEGSPCFTL